MHYEEYESYQDKHCQRGEKVQDKHRQRSEKVQDKPNDISLIRTRDSADPQS